LLTAPDLVQLDAARLTVVPALGGLLIERAALREGRVAFFDVHGPRRELRKLFEAKAGYARLVGAAGGRLLVLEHPDFVARSPDAKIGHARFSLVDADGKVETIDAATTDMTVPGEHPDLEPADWVRGDRVLMIGLADAANAADVAVFDLKKRALRRLGRAQGCVDPTASMPSTRVRVRWSDQANPLPDDEACTNRVDVTSEAITFTPGPITPGH
jgi:hypothetical protein